jgi:chromosome segregation ATPase
MHENLPTETAEHVSDENTTNELGDAALHGVLLAPEISTTEDLHAAVIAGEKRSEGLAGQVNSAIGEQQSSLASTLSKELGESEAELQRAKNDLAVHQEAHPESAELIEALEAAAAADARAEAIASQMAGADSGTVRALSYSLEGAENDLLAARVKIFDLRNAGNELPPEIAELDAEYKKYDRIAVEAFQAGNDPKEVFASAKSDEAKRVLDRAKASLVANAG